MDQFEKYMEFKKFKKVLNLGVFDARDITGWFIEHNDQFENLYLVDNYDFEKTLIVEDSKELIQIINNKIQGKENIDFIIKDGKTIDYTSLDFDLCILDCDSTSAVIKVIDEKPDVVFCMTAFFNSFYRTNQILEWIKNKRIYPFMYLNNVHHIFFTADNDKRAMYYEEASNIDFDYVKYEKFMGNPIIIPKYTKPFYNHQQVKL